MVIVWLVGNNWLTTIATIMSHTIHFHNNHFITLFEYHYKMAVCIAGNVQFNYTEINWLILM